MREIKESVDSIRELVARLNKMSPARAKLCEENGDTLFYMNGNDGTAFDWELNGRLCEFMQFYVDTEMGYTKVFVEDNGGLVGYVYEHDAPYGVLIREYGHIDTDGARKLMCYMRDNADVKGLFDKPLNMICNV